MRASRDTFNNNATAAKFITSEVPPYAINGNGIPVFGIVEVITAMFSNACTLIQIVTPIAKR